MKRYKIFVSGNQKELKRERIAVKEVINNNSTLRSFFDIFLFEDLPAKGRSPASTYLKQVDNSDIYIGIIGNEYGIKGNDGFSATEREFRRFANQNSQREILIFIKDKKDTNKEKDTRRFIEDIKNSYIYKRFLSIDDLKAQTLNSLISYLDEKGILGKLPFDETLCRETEYDEIDEKEVRDFLENRAIKLKVDIPKISIKDFLIKTLKIVTEHNGKLMPTNACVLFFGKNPAEYIPQSEIRIARFRSTTRAEFIDSKEIKDPIYKMLDEVEAFFRRNTRLASKIVEFKRVDIPEYPYEAIREAVINAMAHRDYTYRWAPIMISIFDDRIEISSPGSLLPGLDIKNLEGHHATRNKRICDIFHETKDMEKFGTGIGKMKRFMKNHGLSKPEFLEEGNFFVVRFYGPGDRILDLVSDVPEERMTDLSHLKERQVKTLELIYNENVQISRKEYAKKYDISIRSAQRDLRQLLEENLIVQEGLGRGVKYKKP